MLRVAVTLEEVVSEVVILKLENARVIEQLRTLTSNKYETDMLHQSNDVPVTDLHEKEDGNELVALFQLHGEHVKVDADAMNALFGQASGSTCADVCSVVNQCIDRVQKALDRARGIGKHSFTDSTQGSLAGAQAFHEAS